MNNKANKDPRETHLRSSEHKRAVIPLIGLFSALLLVAACGGDSEPASVQASPPQSSEPAASMGVDVAAAQTGEEIGQAVGDVYLQAFADLVEALADHPEEAVALERMQEVHERHVQDLVALGRKIETLSAGDKATVESAVSRAQSSLQRDPDIKPIYEGYTALNRHYIETGAMISNNEFRRLFSSFNILTQYAFFDLLKRQNPEEAERLGL